jgi:outer membrane protein W
MGTLSFGGKYYFKTPDPCIEPYIGVGGGAAYVKTLDTSPYLPPVTVRWGGLAVGKFGTLMHYANWFYANFFFDYYYQPVKTRESISLPSETVDFGGFRIGAGIG